MSSGRCVGSCRCPGARAVVKRIRAGSGLPGMPLTIATLNVNGIRAAVKACEQPGHVALAGGDLHADVVLLQEVRSTDDQAARPSPRLWRPVAGSARKTSWP